MLRKRWFWAAVAVQVLVLLGMVGVHGYTLMTGRPVLLKTAPIDPWDPFRGEYVTLAYEISCLDPAAVTAPGAPYDWDQKVWVTLEEGEPYWRAVAVSAERQAVGANQVVVRGTVRGWCGGENRISVRYGIEQFYVPEGEGRKLEQEREGLVVEALVDSFGRAALHRVLLNGEAIRWR